MSTITKTETITYCDFCDSEDDSTIPLGWFRVTSTFAESQMAVVRDANLCEPQVWHACANCGRTLYRWLKLLGIDYKFIPAKPDLAEGGRQFGSILVGVKGKDWGEYPEESILVYLARLAKQENG